MWLGSQCWHVVRPQVKRHETRDSADNRDSSSIHIPTRHMCHWSLNLAHTSNSRPWRSIGSFMYIGSAGPGPGGRAEGGRGADGRTNGGQTGGQADGQAAKAKSNNSTTIFIKYHNKKHQQTLVILHPAEAQILMFTIKIKKVCKKMILLTFQIT